MDSEVASDIISATLSAAIATATSLAADPTATGPGGYNGTVPEAPPPYTEGNYVVNAIIGLLIVLGASVFNALGLNLTKLDHQQQQGIPKASRRREYLRPLWLGGMGIYIASQMFGSPLALRYLRPDWVAPLGASALVFNFLFAYWLVGTPVTKSDIRGTALIVLGVILIVVFSSINHGLRQDLPIDELNRLWTRGSWLAYFFVLVAATLATCVMADALHKVLRSRASFSPLPTPPTGLPTTTRSAPESRFAGIKRPFLTVYAHWKAAEYAGLAHLERMLARSDDARVVWLEGIAWAVAGGSLAGLCLVFTKGVVKIFFLPGHPLVHPSPLLTLVLTIITAVAQIICLNKALACADTVVVVPIFYAGYTVFGFLNSLIFYDQSGQYAGWALAAVFLSISVLISGVVLLSMKRVENTETQTPVVNLQAPRRQRASSGASSDETAVEREGESQRPVPKDEVMWQVGEDSDSDEEGEDGERSHKGHGVGGTRGDGERGGLLFANEEEDEDHPNEHMRSRARGNSLVRSPAVQPRDSLE